MLNAQLATPSSTVRPNPGADPSEWACAHERFRAHVEAPSFPCTGAKSALNTGRYHFVLFDELGGHGVASKLCDALYEFLDDYPNPGLKPVTFIAAFSSTASSEIRFESQLWAQLQRLHDVDRMQHDWDPAVANNPADPSFSLSIGGRGFFVVGLHPSASRLARRAPFDTLVFNLHSQFEDMRASGSYGRMERVVRDRDVALQGSVNPVLARHGEASAALQYAGRSVDRSWTCPFQPRGAA